MTIGDLPTMAKSAFTSTAYAGNDFTTSASPFVGLVAAAAQNSIGAGLTRAFIPSPQAQQEKPMAKQPRRLVQVFVADPDDNIPLDMAVLYRGGQHLTDATDQELFYEIELTSILKKHNEERVKLVNKKVKERTEYLDPAKIRDLKMVVVDIATF